MFSTLSQVPGLLPQFETKRALIIINLQNDSLYCNDDVYITKNREFVDRIKALVPHFRKLGEVVWIRTEMGTKSFPTSPGSAYIEEEVAKIDEKNREERKLEEQQLEDDTVQVQNGVDDAHPERQNLESGPPAPVQTYHPTSRTQAMMKRASAKSRAEQRSANMDIFNDGGDVFEEHVSKPRKGQQPKFYVGGTLGAEIADQLRSVVDESKDLMVTKHHYSAFDQTSLLMSLRMKLVTDVYLCGCLTNVGVYATAADAVQHGLGVTVVEDCLGYRSEAKHEDAMRQMADIMGVNGVDSEEIIEESGGGAPPDAEESMFTGPGPEGITLETLSIDGKSPTRDAADAIPNPVDRDRAEIEAPVSPTNMSKDATSADLDHETRSSVSVDPTDRVDAVPVTDPMTEKLAAQPSISVSDGLTPLPSPDVSSSKKRDSWMSVGTHTLGPNDSIGSGDSRIIHDVLSAPLIDDAFQRLQDEVKWQTMHHRSGKVPRLVAVQGEIGKDGSVPLYRHPADESPRLLSYSPTIERIRKEMEELLKQPFNHALIQLYRDGNDNISEHSDKVGSTHRLTCE
ncbi:hypothetical protein MMC07_006976 [Pseudocyphellaria aurata]|nr:hypothetical protein [Pseudocyphellaria aurata]